MKERTRLPQSKTLKINTNDPQGAQNKKEAIGGTNGKKDTRTQTKTTGPTCGPPPPLQPRGIPRPGDLTTQPQSSKKNQEERRLGAVRVEF